jgi:hypothetical protein
MKKVLLASLIGLLFASCGNIYNFEGATLKTIPIRIEAHEWQYSNADNNNYFFADFSEREMYEINREVFDKGEVKVYLVTNKSTASAQKNPLPYSLHAEEYNGKEWIFYTQTIDYAYGVKWLRVYFSMSDFEYEINESINPPAMDFDVVITYPQD